MSAPVTCDADRIAQATQAGDVMNGPVEYTKCFWHPHKWETYRWHWPVGHGPECGDVEPLGQCDHPSHDD